ncbi:hypothetical protein HPB51_006381 [Rhipicephalus microplus]|uniref:Uncharacterized protein n=1 Tax=Rhipicephalus microplus TaxID=6941 RepID=A0A9J6DLL0_RHIMP|nr:hypothetical protein HPB51_006381 [Rhipicephalus microplus]
MEFSCELALVFRDPHRLKPDASFAGGYRAGQAVPGHWRAPYVRARAGLRNEGARQGRTEKAYTLSLSRYSAAARRKKKILSAPIVLRPEESHTNSAKGFSPGLDRAHRREDSAPQGRPVPHVDRRDLGIAWTGEEGTLAREDGAPRKTSLVKVKHALHENACVHPDTGSRDRSTTSAAGVSSRFPRSGDIPRVGRPLLFSAVQTCDVRAAVPFPNTRTGKREESSIHGQGPGKRLL